LTTDPLFMKVGGQYYFYQNDHLGTPQKLTAVNGAVVWSGKYNAFGEAEVDPSSTVINNLRFPGQYIDQETGLHYNWFRYYAPRMGRYLTADPIGLAGGINLFSYASQNPVNAIDPFGLDDIYIWDLSPGPEVFIKPIGYMYDMRHKFKQEYKRRVEFCRQLYNPDDECNPNRSNYNTCVEYPDVFKYYSENYGYWHAMFNSWFWNSNENIERLKNKLRPVEYDIFYYWDGKKYSPKTIADK
jgi:RHS repeat-associated protein